MDLIAEQPYVKVERQVNGIEQKDIEDYRTMYLYKEKLITKYREFPIHEILDMSYRQIGHGGLLYLHTSKGVFSYQIQSSPEQFIRKFKQHFK